MLFPFGYIEASEDKPLKQLSPNGLHKWSKPNMDSKSVEQFREGDMVYPSPSNPMKFKEHVKFPLRVHAVKGDSLILEMPMRTGATRKERWFAGFWTRNKPQGET